VEIWVQVPARAPIGVLHAQTDAAANARPSVAGEIGVTARATFAGSMPPGFALYLLGIFCFNLQSPLSPCEGLQFHSRRRQAGVFGARAEWFAVCFTAEVLQRVGTKQ